MVLRTSPRRSLALDESECMCPWPLSGISYPFYILVHSFDYILCHWCFSRNCKKGNIISFVFILLSHRFLLFILFSITAVYFLLFSAFLDSVLSFHIFLAHCTFFLLLTFHCSCFSPISLRLPFFSILFYIFPHKCFLLSSCSGVEMLILPERTFKKMLFPQYSSAMVVIQGEIASGRH